MPQSIVGMELTDIRQALGAAEPTFRARQIYEAVYRRRVTDLAAISNLPRALRARLGSELPLGLPEIERRYDSTDGTRRYLLRLADGKTVETVWMPEGDHLHFEPGGVSGRLQILSDGAAGARKASDGGRDRGAGAAGRGG
jgi:adenine C2-methylase RlmN of 23S rRNA A2503 and tRNA A37